MNYPPPIRRRLHDFALVLILMAPCFAGTFPVLSQESDTSFQFSPEALSEDGGLLAQNSVCHDTAMPALGQNETHIERLYRNLGHGFTVIISGANQSAEFQSNMFKRVREDIIHWINLY